MVVAVFFFLLRQWSFRTLYAFIPPVVATRMWSHIVHSFRIMVNNGHATLVLHFVYATNWKEAKFFFRRFLLLSTIDSTAAEALQGARMFFSCSGTCKNVKILVMVWVEFTPFLWFQEAIHIQCVDSGSASRASQLQTGPTAQAECRRHLLPCALSIARPAFT
jgi:hypothetical protein